MASQLFGWVPPEERTTEQQECFERIVAGMPAFSLPGYQEGEGRFPLWKFCQQTNGGRHIPYVWQLTGSCVGAGGSNAMRTLARVEIAAGEAEEWQEPWWPYTYGQSRRRAGLSGRGEGSFGAAWADAIVKDGVFSVPEGEAHKDLPDFRDVDGWLQLTRDVELQWSDGSANNVEPWRTLGLKHPIRTAAPVRDTRELKAGIANGYPATIASMFGTRGIQQRGNPAVNVAEYNDRWAHQMYVDEAWDHPSLGLLFRIGNNWGPGAHPAPTQGEPPGGFYVTEATMARVLGERGTECYLFSAFEGFKVRKLDWFI